MKFGIFDHVDDSGVGATQFFEDRLNLVEALDRLGFHAYHVAEHHGTPLGMSGSPNVYLSSVAQRTKRLRFGPLVYLPVMYHPLRLAEEVAMLDHLSHGRLEMGVGRGAVFIEQQSFGVNPDEVPERYNEARDILIQALTSDTVNFKGKHYVFEDFKVMIRPVQQPHPPLWYGLSSPETAVWCAANDVNAVSLAPAARAAVPFARYREEWDKLGKAPADIPLMGINRHVVVAPTEAEARKTAISAYDRWYANFSQLWERKGVPTPPVFPTSWEAQEAAGLGVAGPPDKVREFLADQLKTAGATYLVGQMIFGDIPYQGALQSLEMFAKEVAPGLGG